MRCLHAVASVTDVMKRARGLSGCTSQTVLAGVPNCNLAARLLSVQHCLYTSGNKRTRPSKS